MIILIKLLLYIGLLLLLGGTIARHILTPHFPPRRILIIGFCLLVFGATLSVWWPLYQFGYTNPEEILEYLTGITAGRAALSVIMGGCVLLAAELSSLSWLAFIGAGAITLWGVAGIGHGASHGEQIRSLHTMHALSMTVWLGGILALLLSKASNQEYEMKRWRLFSPIALICAICSITTGIFMSLSHAGPIQGWFNTSYGLLLIGKIALTFSVLILAVNVRKRLQSKDNIHLLLWLEVIVLLIIIFLTSILGQTPSPAHPI